MPAPRNIKLTSVRKPKANKRRIKIKKRILRSVLNAARSARPEDNGRNIVRWLAQSRLNR